MKRDDTQGPDTSAANRKASMRSNSSQSATTVVGPSISISGDMQGDEDVLIEGQTSGTLQLRQNKLTVGKQGRVKADLDVHTISIEGAMEGDLRAADRVAITQSAKFKGTISAPRVRLDDGAQFNGSIDMSAQGAKAATGNQRPPATSSPSYTSNPTAPTAPHKDSGANTNAPGNPTSAGKQD